MRAWSFRFGAALTALAFVLGLNPGRASAQTAVFINELHYDNSGTDADEGVEVAGPAGTDLTGWSVALYNGNGGAVYDTIALSGTIPDQGNGFGTLYFLRAGIQNGAQDVRLDTVLQPGQYVLVFDGANATSFGSLQATVELTDLVEVDRLCRSAPMLQPGRTVNGVTRGERDHFQATCADGATSGDRVYRVRVQRRSRVRVDMTSDFDGALHMRRDCADPSSELACNDDHDNNNRRSRVEATVDPGTYFVIVDGYSNGNEGSFSLEVDVSRP